MDTRGDWYCIEMNLNAVRWADEIDDWADTSGRGSLEPWSPREIQSTAIRGLRPENRGSESHDRVRFTHHPTIDERRTRSTREMNSLETVDAATLLSGRSDWIGTELAEVLSRDPRDSIETEFPHHVGSVDSRDDFERPTEQHPVFYGCFDWHSSVHSHWCLVRQLRLFDGHPAASEIASGVAARLTSENVEREVEYFEANPSFEKPYGWAWLLRLAAELRLWEDDRADEWRTTLKPLEEQIVTLVQREFLTQARPFRVGTHQNSAFALQGVLDYARVTDDGALESAAIETSRAFFANDRNAPVEYEPLGWDFLSPTLTEADLMRRALDRDEFATWLDAFLPDVTASPFDRILEPIEIGSKPDEGIAHHLVGLNLAKAWSLAGVAETLGDHRYAEPFERSAAKHATRGVAQAFTDDYAGAHWLSSFVLYLLTRNEGGISLARGVRESTRLS